MTASLPAFTVKSMGKVGWFAVTVAAVVIFVIVHTPVTALVVLGIGVAYYISLRVHPRTRHTGFRGCGGTGEQKGSVFRWGFRRCPGCQSGRIVRWGAGQFGAERMQAEYKRGKAARKRAKAEHTWR